MAHPHDQDPHGRHPQDREAGTPSEGGWPDQPAAERTGSSTSWYAESAAADEEATRAQAPSYSEEAARPAAGLYGTGAPAYGAAPADAHGRPAYAQPPYGEPVYTGGGHAPASADQSGTGLSIASMVVGILSVIGGFTLVVPPIVGVVLGHMGLKREPRGRGFAIAGLVTNYLSLAFLALGILLFLLLIVFAGAAATSGGY